MNLQTTEGSQDSPSLWELCFHLIENCTLPTVIVEGEAFRVKVVNPAFRRLISSPREPLVGLPLPSLLPSGEGNRCTLLLQAVQKTGGEVTLSEPTSFFSEPLPLFSQISPIYWHYLAWSVPPSPGFAGGIVVQLTDKTEEVKAKREEDKTNLNRLKANEQLLIASLREQEVAANAEQQMQAQKMESIGRMAGGIAHDFNNLLTVIIGLADLAEEEISPEHNVAVYVRGIHQAADRAATLTGQILAFARKQRIVPQVVNLNTVIEEMQEVLRQLGGEKVDLRFSLTPELHSVKVDPAQFGQVLMNLVVNARDVLADGGEVRVATSNIRLGEKEATLSELPVGDYVLLTVTDTGSGIPDDVRPHLFEPFFTTKEPGKGTGMGLSTCYGIIRQSGGHIGVFSESGIGTTFHIYLPRTFGAVLPPVAKEVKTLPRGTETILFVEDEPSLRQIGVTMLKRQGYTVFEAENGKVALEWLRLSNETVHLLVTDVRMPEMGGRELAENLRRLLPEVKILFISGYNSEELFQQENMEAGMAYLQKPLDFALLANRVRQMLDEETTKTTLSV